MNGGFQDLWLACCFPIIAIVTIVIPKKHTGPDAWGRRSDAAALWAAESGRANSRRGALVAFCDRRRHTNVDGHGRKTGTMETAMGIFHHSSSVGGEIDGR